MEEKGLAKEQHIHSDLMWGKKQTHRNLEGQIQKY